MSLNKSLNTGTDQVFTTAQLRAMLSELGAMEEARATSLKQAKTRPAPTTYTISAAQRLLEANRRVLGLTDSLLDQLYPHS